MHTFHERHASLRRRGVYAFERWKPPAHPFATTDDLRKWQKGRCAACGTDLFPLQHDHDHDTGLIRGLLCQSCNQDEGRLRFGPWLRWQTGTHPANLYGLVEVYVSPWGNRPRFSVSDEADAAALFRLIGLDFATFRRIDGDEGKAEALARVLALRDRVHADRTARAAKEAEESAAWTH